MPNMALQPIGDEVEKMPLEILQHPGMHKRISLWKEQAGRAGASIRT